MHFFYNDAAPHSTDYSYEAAQVTLVDPYTKINLPAPQNVLINWGSRENRDLSRAARVLAAASNASPNCLIRWGNGYIRNLSDTDNLRTTRNVGDTNTPIGPSGHSGIVSGPHLHISAHIDYPNNFYDVNPLYFIMHDAPAYTRSILYPDSAENSILYRRSGASEAQQLNERVRLNINSEAGKDLDRVKLYFIGKDTPQDQIVYDETTLSTSVVYGGLPPDIADARPTPSYITHTGNTNRGSFSKTGVDPQGTAVGHDDFYFIGFNTRINRAGTGDALINSEAKFPDGNYNMVFRAHSIRNNNTDIFFDTSTKVYIDSFRPYTEGVEFTDINGDPRYRRAWTLNPDGQLVSPAAEYDLPLLPGRSYEVRAVFSEYMDPENGVGMNLEGRAMDDNRVKVSVVPGAPQSVYKATFTVQPGLFQQDGQYALAIQGLDIPKGKDADGNPIFGNPTLRVSSAATVIDLATQFTRGADGLMQGAPGQDTFHRIRVDVNPPVVTYEKPAYTYHECMSMPGTVQCGFPGDPVNLTNNQAKFTYKDLGSGIKNIKIISADSGGFSQEYNFNGVIDSYPLTLELNDGNYIQTVTDNVGRSTTMYFRIDPETPRLAVSGIAMAQDFSSYTIYGVVQDTGSGMAFFRLERESSLPRDFALTTGTVEQLAFSLPGLPVEPEETNPGYFKFTAQDMAGNLNSPWPLTAFTRTPPAPDLALSNDDHAVANYLTEIQASSGPCTITVNSAPNTFALPVSYTAAGSVAAELPAYSEQPVTVANPNKYLHGRLTVDVSPQVCDQYGCQPACDVVLKGHSVMGWLVGPTAGSYRNSPQPANYNITYNRGFWDFTVKNTDAVAPHQVAVREVGSLEALPLNHILLGACLFEFRSSFDGVEIKRVGLDPNFTAEDLGRIRMLAYHDDGTVEDITTEATASYVAGETLRTSTFAVVAPIDIFDKAGPVVNVVVEKARELDGRVYISSLTPVGLFATDISSNSHVFNGAALAGVASTYYLIDKTPADCQSAAYDPAAQPGTCENPVYSSPFLLPEGVHTVHYHAVDKLANFGDAGYKEFHVDGTAPEAAAGINDVPLAAGTTAYATDADTVTFAAADIISKGVASGLAISWWTSPRKNASIRNTAAE